MRARGLDYNEDCTRAWPFFVMYIGASERERERKIMVSGIAKKCCLCGSELRAVV